MRARIDMTGKQYGAWTVVDRSGPNNLGQSTCLCRCQCGTTRTVVAATLRTGASGSCGCLKPQAIAKARTKHGASSTKCYQVWRDMVRRCTVSKHRQWHYYGGRGIKVCQRWLSFENFRADMGEPPAGLEIERIDNNGDYEPDNCTWATHAQQMANQQRSAKYQQRGMR
jgi:hypothetical protein